MEDSVILENEDGMEIGFTVREVRTSNLVVGTNSVIYDLNDYTIVSINGFPVVGREVTNDLTVVEDAGELFAEKVVDINAAKEAEAAAKAQEKAVAAAKAAEATKAQEKADAAAKVQEEAEAAAKAQEEAESSDDDSED